MSEDVYILAIESSCDETAASVVKNGREVLSNVISSQIDLHTLYGGVVPEIASRKHIEKINQVVEEALKEADLTLEQVTAIAVTYGPGLVGALLVGVAAAKAIAFAANKPLIGVHHIEGHICANFIENKELEPPFACLVVSGGHTHLVKVTDYGKYEIALSHYFKDAVHLLAQVQDAVFVIRHLLDGPQQFQPLLCPDRPKQDKGFHWREKIQFPYLFRHITELARQFLPGAVVIIQKIADAPPETAVKHCLKS